MEMENTTVLSVVVWMAGVLAEILFYRTLSSSYMGMAMSGVLALVVLCCTYFILDGINRSVRKARSAKELEQREQTDKLYQLLEDQIKLQKAIYVMVKNNQEVEKKDSDGLDIDESGQSQHGRLVQMADQINDNTMRAAKLVAKYTAKQTEETTGTMDELLRISKRLDHTLQQISTDVQDVASRPNPQPVQMVSVPTTVAPVTPVLPTGFADTSIADTTVMSTEPALAEDAVSAAEATASVEAAATEDMLDGMALEDATEDMLDGMALDDVTEDIPDETSLEDVPEESVDLSEKSMEEVDDESQEETAESDQGMTALDMLMSQQSSEVALEETPEEVTEEPMAETTIPMPSFPDIDMSDPNREMSADEIAALFASVNGSATSEPESAPVDEVLEVEQEESVPLPDMTPAAPSDPNQMMSQDDIAALLASMNN